VVLSIEEKTGIKDMSRKRPTKPVRSGQPERREFEYRRHGTASLLAAMDVTTGRVTVRDISRNDSVTFISFLGEIEEGLAIHVVMDNGSSHTSKATEVWLVEHPRFVAHHTRVIGNVGGTLRCPLPADEGLRPTAWRGALVVGFSACGS